MNCLAGVAGLYSCAQYLLKMMKGGPQQYTRSPKMDRKILEARVRTVTGKGAAKRIRAEGRIPAVIYDGEGKSSLIDILESDFNKLFHQITRTTTIDIKLDDGRDVIAFVKDAQHDIISDRVRHVDFYAVDSDKIIRTKIRVHVTGAPDAVRLGGVLETGVSEIEIECLPRALPERIAVDVTKLGLNETVFVSDLKLGDGVKILTHGEFPIASVKHVRSNVSAATEDAAAGDSEAASEPASAK